jgi:hypothetical protein
VGINKLVQLMAQLIKSTQENQNHGGNNGLGGTNGHNGNQNHRGNNGAGGSNGNNGNNAEGNNHHIPTQVGTRNTDRIIPRTLMPQFLGDQQT